MSDLTTQTGGGQIVGFEPKDARTAVTAFNARAEIEARNGNVEAAKEYVDKALAVQRAFVIWWDKQERDEGGRPTETRNSTVTGLSLADVAPDLDRMTVSRWRKALVGDDPEDATPYMKALAKAEAKIQRLCNFDAAPTLAREFTGEVQWYTPVRYIEAARQAMGGIDLDPASTPFANETVKATRFYTESDDGLAQDWSGRVWLNPPYKMPAVKDFAHRMAEAWSAGQIDAGIVLTNNATDTTWWHVLSSVASVVCFTYGRISFYNEDGEHSSPTNGQNFHYFGADLDAFCAAFAEIGLCMVRR